jgi:hypothetical protein
MTTMRTARSRGFGRPEPTLADRHGIGHSACERGFATVPDDGHLRIMVAHEDVLAACADVPASCQRLFWGTRLDAGRS